VPRTLTSFRQLDGLILLLLGCRRGLQIRHKLCNYALNIIMEVFKEPFMAAEVHIT
jgi:hypothetical protein